MRRRDGFTLLEMLVTIVVTATLVAGAVQAFQGITRAQERATGHLERDRYAQVFLDRLERELVGTLLIVKPQGADRLAHPYLFLGEDRFDSEHEVDALRFVTQTPARAASKSVEPGLRMVSYAVISDDRGGLALVRQEEELPEGMKKEIELLDPSPVFDGLARFQVRYLDELTGEWLDSWDSTDVALLDRLPLEIEVGVALVVTDESGEPADGEVHERRVALPVRELDVARLRAEAFGNAPAADGECVTVAECVSLFDALLENASHTTTLALTKALEASSDQCWDNASELADRIRAMGGNPEQACSK